MKKSIVLLALITFSLSWGQDIFEKYEYDDSVSYFSINPKIFQMLAKLSIETGDPEADKFIKLVEEIKSFKLITTERTEIAEDIQIWVEKHIKTQNLEELMRVRDIGAHVNFYVKSTENDNRVEKLLMFVTDINEDQIKLANRNPETVLLYLTGDIDLNQISMLVKEMNLPGGELLGKLNEK